MSAKVMGQVWDLDLPHNQQSVLLAYADHADHEGHGARPRRKLVAWKTGYSEDSVQRITKELRDGGLLVLTQPAKPGYAPVYFVNTAAGTRKPPLQDRERPGVQDDHPSAGKGGQGTTALGGHPCTPQPSKEPSRASGASPPQPSAGEHSALWRWRQAGAPTKVARREVLRPEAEAAFAALAAFNDVAGTRYGIAANGPVIVRRVREQPDLTADEHRAIIEANFREPWWEGRPGVEVIYGNAGAFERAIERWRAGPPAGPPSGPRQRHPNASWDAEGVAERTRREVEEARRGT